MSINPVPSTMNLPIAPVDAPPRPEPTPPAIAPGDGSLPSDSGSRPKTELPVPLPAAGAEEMPQDEVQVQRNDEANGEIVIKYLDGRGKVILQVPSSQVLDLERSIAQELAASEGGTQPRGGNVRGH